MSDYKPGLLFFILFIPFCQKKKNCHILCKKFNQNPITKSMEKVKMLNIKKNNKKKYHRNTNKTSKKVKSGKLNLKTPYITDWFLFGRL